MPNPKEDDQQQGSAEPPVETKPQVTIDLTEVDDDEGDRAPATAAPENAETRKGRRAQIRETREREARERDRADSLERQLSEMRGQLSALQRQPVVVHQQSQQATDPVEAEIEALTEQQQILLRAAANPQAAQEDIDRASAQWRKLDRQRRALEIRQVVGDRQQGNGAPNEGAVVNQLLHAEFPEIFVNNEPMRMRAMAEFQDLMARGKPPSISTAREACERVMAERGLRKAKPPAPTANQQSRYTSVPSRAGASGSSSGQYTPTQSVLRTARAYTEHIAGLSDEERVRKWVKDIGRPNGLV